MKRLVIAALALAAVFTVAGSALAASSQSATIFDSTVNVGPKSNLSSDGLEATSAAQIGGEVTLQGSSKRNLTSATVTLSSWACVDGHHGRHRHPCVTPTGATYSLPITLNIYKTTGDAPDVQAADVRRRVPPVRQSHEVRLPSWRQPTKWYSTTDKKCFNGLAQDVTFTFDGTKSLPDNFRYGITYGTSHYGSPPIGDQACTSTVGRLLLRLAERRRKLLTTPAPPRTRCSSTDDWRRYGVTDQGYTPAVQFKAGS